MSAKLKAGKQLLRISKSDGRGQRLQEKSGRGTKSDTELYWTSNAILYRLKSLVDEGFNIRSYF